MADPSGLNRFFTEDPNILAYTAKQNLVVVTHDEHTMPDFFWKRIAEGHAHAGMIVIPTERRGEIQAIVRYLEAAQTKPLSSQVWWYPILPP